MKIINRYTGAIIQEIGDLCGADLCGADLCGADLCGADLRGADLCGADLREADLRGANLYGANLYGANLCGANLRGANLIVGGFRSDGYQFLLHREPDGSIKVRAGCRYFSLNEARIHWDPAKRGSPVGDESLVLVDGLVALAKIAGWLK